MGILVHLFSFKGRAGRAEFMLVHLLAGALFAMVALAGIVGVAGNLDGAGAEEARNAFAGAGLAVIAPALVALMWSSYAAAARRLHDRDKSARWLILFAAPSAIFWLTAVTSGFKDAFAATASGPIAWFSFVSMIWYSVELGFMRGTDGPNRFDIDRSTSAAIKGDFHGSWADMPIETLAARAVEVAAAAPKPRKGAAANTRRSQGFGRRGART